MISPDIETRALEHLAADEFCAPSEIETVVALWDGDVNETGPLVAEWTERGWVEILSQDDPKLPPLLHLTAAGYAEVERRRTAS
jgi:hypothetical protein